MKCDQKCDPELYKIVFEAWQFIDNINSVMPDTNNNGTETR